MSNKIPGQIGHVGRVLDLALRERQIDVHRVVNATTGMNAAQAQQALRQLHESGKLFKARVTGKVTLYFIDQAERDAYVAEHGEYDPKAPVRKAQKPGALKLSKDAAPAKEYPPPKVTICPSWTHDPRIQLDPSIKRLPEGMKGAGFVQEWNRKRRSRVTARSQA